MQKLQQEPFYKNSIIYIYGDHGSYTNIADQVGNGDNTFPALEHSQVPLIILNSGLGAAQIGTPGSHLDLYPTVANLAGIAPPPDILGQDLLNDKSPVVVRQNVGAGTINTIVTPTLAFKADDDGEFNEGICLKMPDEAIVPVDDCRDLYDNQSNTIRASDIIVRGNLLNTFLANATH